MKKLTNTTTPVVKLEQQAGGTTSNSSNVSAIRPIPSLDQNMPTISPNPRQPMGPPLQPPTGYRSAIYSNNNLSNQIMVLPRLTPVNTQLGNSILRRATAPAVPGIAGATDEKASYDDVLTFTGVDLKEETDNILRENELLGARQSTSTLQLPDRSRTQSFLDQNKLASVVTSIAMQQKLGVNPDVMAYLALATQERIRSLVEAMIAAKNHRIHSEHTHHPSVNGVENLPMYKEIVSLDVKSQLLAIEKVEREQERKRKESRAGSKHDKTEYEDAKDQSENTPVPIVAPKRHKRQKKEREGTLPIPSIHKLTVDTKNTNMTALSAAGGKTKSWMIDIQPQISTINGSDTTPVAASKPSRGRSRSISNAKNLASTRKGESQRNSFTNFVTNPSITGQQQPLNGPVPTITVKDALFVLEKDRGGGGGVGSSREVLMKGYVNLLR
ncbi:14288_t:CDS:2 [Funneliformis geosporum]|uniref:Transcription initiation factor TFIID subunit 4 n=1 Tax=Funneliformis geosporum TaxID=1117311 RepID=A0A9W4SZS6_9GLOM|nr:14288_t:CDS:2 [Funneliformis geosporum]